MISIFLKHSVHFKWYIIFWNTLYSLNGNYYYYYYYYYHYYYYYSLIRAFHISVSRWFSTGVWVTASLFKSPGLFFFFFFFFLLLFFFFFFLLLLLLLLFYFFESFSYQRWLVVFHWSLSDSKSPQVSWTLLSILADLNNAVVWMVSPSPLISKSSSLFTKSLVTVPNPPITIGIIVTFSSHSFFFQLSCKFCNYHYFTPLKVFHVSFNLYWPS